MLAGSTARQHWVSAFGRILREKSPIMTHKVVYDDTPVSVYMHRIYTRLKREGTLKFGDLFEGAVKKSTFVLLFRQSLGANK